MTNSKLIHMIKALELSLREEIAKAERGESNKPIQQLNTIANELEVMKAESGFVPSFPRMIIDSWDYDDPVGKQLMTVFSLYKR